MAFVPKLIKPWLHRARQEPAAVAAAACERGRSMGREAVAPPCAQPCQQGQGQQCQQGQVASQGAAVTLPGVCCLVWDGVHRGLGSQFPRMVVRGSAWGVRVCRVHACIHGACRRIQSLPFASDSRSRAHLCLALQLRVRASCQQLQRGHARCIEQLGGADGRGGVDVDGSNHKPASSVRMLAGMSTHLAGFEGTLAGVQELTGVTTILLAAQGPSCEDGHRFQPETLLLLSLCPTWGKQEAVC